MLQGTGSGPAGACPTRECGWVSAFSFIKALQEDQFEYPEELRSLDGPSWWALAQRGTVEPVRVPFQREETRRKWEYWLRGGLGVDWPPV